MTKLTGITWDHPRGYAPLHACTEYEDVRVDWEVRSLKDFGDATLSDLAARYDLIILDHPHSGEAATGILRPYDDILAPEVLAALRSDNDTTSFRSYFYNNKQWALPIDAACKVASYRPDLMQNASIPSTWKDVFALADNLSKQGQFVGMALCPTDTLCSFLTLAAQAGDAPKQNQWIQDDTCQRVLEQLACLRDASHPESLNWNPIQLYERMSGNESDVAYSPLAFGYTDYARESSTRPHRLRFANIPETHSALLGGAGIGISAGCQHPQVAARYAAWICGAEIQRTRYTESGGQPAHRAAWLDRACDQQTGHFLSDTHDTLEQAYTRPRLPDWPQFQEALGDTVHDFLKCNVSLQSTIEELKRLHQHHLQHSIS